MPQIIHNQTYLRYFQRDPILLNSIKLEPSKAYFIYIGEIKAYGLNAFLKPVLEQIYCRPVECIALVPDLLGRYPYSNLAVLNRDSFHYYSSKGIRVNCRPSAGSFAREVSASFLAQELIESIILEQDFVYIHMFASRQEMKLVDGERVKLLGPDPTLAHHFNNKITQYQMACQLAIPLPEGFCCNCLEEALESAQTFFRCGEEVFVSEAYSAAGSNSAFASNRAEIQQRFVGSDQPYLVTRRVPHRYDPTVLAVVANAQEVTLLPLPTSGWRKTDSRVQRFPQC